MLRAKPKEIRRGIIRKVIEFPAEEADAIDELCAAMGLSFKALVRLGLQTVAEANKQKWPKR